MMPLETFRILTIIKNIKTAMTQTQSAETSYILIYEKYATLTTTFI